MPELPEVETIRLGLEKYLVGHKIEKVEIRLPKIFHGNPKDIEGAKVRGVRRFGKALVIDLDNGFSIAAHIKLTGQFIYIGPNSPNRPNNFIGGELPNKWTHVIFKLKAKRSYSEGIPRSGNLKAFLYYNDLRQFGWIKIIKTSEVEKFPFIKELGPEPQVVTDNKRQVTGREYLTLKIFRGILSKSKTKIKPLLMDQKKIGGIGNIYANDALLLARIDPRRRANSLGQTEQSKLYHAIITVLKRGLKYGGATEINFVNALGQSGRYQEHFLAYGKEGKPCPFCGSKIKKIRLAGRGTYFCSGCQK